ncbi:hypothetical protein [Culicoidibacter larvae]|uniref:Uncharacterized protein n=1 Tax=Culicoidibacter larvae TaxID=2579976 RepID=A0A5R8Q8M7_9FIRM|nr:hypothetical protein [Culicoidibacter larvae]TLG71154.1 hypothetical protein FEZ08_11410 [Culicoidibacter larvae]
MENSQSFEINENNELEMNERLEFDMMHDSLQSMMAKYKAMVAESHALNERQITLMESLSTSGSTRIDAELLSIVTAALEHAERSKDQALVFFNRYNELAEKYLQFNEEKRMSAAQQAEQKTQADRSLSTADQELAKTIEARRAQYQGIEPAAVPAVAVASMVAFDYGTLMTIKYGEAYFSGIWAKIVNDKVQLDFPKYAAPNGEKYPVFCFDKQLNQSIGDALLPHLTAMKKGDKQKNLALDIPFTPALTLVKSHKTEKGAFTNFSYGGVYINNTFAGTNQEQEQYMSIPKAYRKDKEAEYVVTFAKEALEPVVKTLHVMVDQYDDKIIQKTDLMTGEISTFERPQHKQQHQAAEME